MARRNGRNGNGFNRIPLREIRAYARRIVEKFNPEKIILFGSYGYGKPSEDSDVDLLVVMKTRRRELKMIVEVRRACAPAPFPLDLLVRRPEVLARRIKEGDWFLEEIVERGKVLYERSAA